MPIFPSTARFDRAFFEKLADYMAVGVAMALPWSTTATGIFVVLWFLIALATTDWTTLKRSLLTPAGGLPVLLFGFGAIGMLWADVTWVERLAGFTGFIKLPAVPLLLAHFRRSARGECVVYAFLISASIVLVVSLISAWSGVPTGSGKLVGIPAHDDIFQNSEFLLCAFGLFGFAFYQMGRATKWRSILCFAFGLVFLIDIVTVIFSRIALTVVPVLIILLGWRLLRW